MKCQRILKSTSYTILAAAVLLAGCGGGGGGSGDSLETGNTEETTNSENTDNTASVVAVTPPEQMDVVSATEDANSNTSSFVRALMSARAFSDANTDYTLDEQHAHIWHPALEPIETVNSILCFIDQLGADSMLGQGPYAALIDDGKCEEGSSGGSSSSGNQSSGAGRAPEFVEVVAESNRASNSDPMIISLWIPEMEMGDDDASMLIKARIAVSQSPSETLPFGEFSMSFGFFPEGSTTSTGGGQLSTISNDNNQFGFEFYESNSQSMDFGDMPGGPSGEVNIQFSQKAAVLTNAAQTDGVAVTQSSFSIEGIDGNPFGESDDGPSNNAFALSFDSEDVKVRTGDDYSALLADTGSDDVCLSRNEYQEAVWRYNLYDADTGERVEVNSGFPFRYATDSNSPTNYDGFGYVGYWGVWTEQGSLTNGQTIVRDTHGDDTEDEDAYSVTTAPGKLIKYSAESLALTELDGIAFHYWDSELGNYDQWVVEYLTVADDSVDADGFYKTGGLSWSSDSSHGGPSTTDLETPELITLESEYDALHMWSQQLGGGVNWHNGDTAITFYAEEFIDGDETGTGELFSSSDTVTLYCYDQCPTGILDQTDLSTYDGPYENPLRTESETVTPIAYTFSLTGDNAFTLVRTSNGESVVMASDLSRQALQNSFHSWGIHTGKLVTQSVSDALTSPWDIYNPSEVTTFYKWETGLDDWNRMTFVMQDGEVVTFDKPIEFRYTHATANDRSSDETVAARYDGQTFMLNYGGNGDLWGIPHRAVGEASEEVGENEQHVRYYPLFNLADGVELGPNDAYVVKAIDIEQKMARNSDGCINLNYDGLASPPSGLGDDYNISIGDLPDVDESPAVVAGEVQTASTE